MNKKQELTHMRDSLRKSKVIEGMAITPARERMLERELTVVRVIGGYRGNPLENVQQSDLVPERFQSRSVDYTPRGSKYPLATVAVDIPNTGCGLLPEAIGEDGYIHINVEHGMNIGILFARAKSPVIDQKGHSTRTVLIRRSSEVKGLPFVYSETGAVYDASGAHLLVARNSEKDTYEKAEELMITGENTFLDVIPGRVRMEGNIITALTEILSDKKAPYTGKPDLTLVLQGERLPAEEDIDPKQLEEGPRSRGISLGETVDVHYEMEGRKFNPSTNPKNTYKLEFVFD